MFERYTEKARRVIFFARHEASHFGASAIEAEHILLGLMREDKDLTNRFFQSSQASIESIRKEVEGRSIVHEKSSSSVDLPLSPEAKRVLAYTAEESERLKDRHIGTEHLLLGLLREVDSIAANILQEKGLDINIIRDELKKNPIDPRQPKQEDTSDNLADSLPAMIEQMRVFANAMLKLCDKMESKYKELDSNTENKS
jgi:ATP-dependent Clp protease ATP-binding subunit ClpC